MPIHGAGKPKLVISSCLLGEKTRYNGDHSKDENIIKNFTARFALVPVCPETEAGLGVPREPVRLEGDAVSPRAVTAAGEDLTERLRSCAASLADNMDDVCGFILKSKSPSCAVNSAKLFDGETLTSETAAGLFAREAMTRHPQMPVAEDTALAEPGAAGDFIERAVNYGKNHMRK